MANPEPEIQSCEVAMKRFVYTLEFDSNNNSAEYVMKLMMPVIKGTLFELDAKNVKQDYKIVEDVSKK